ncbi:zinc finger and BTB domain-containing protein 22 [Myotis daubentonii]|uniref:zinc finger and BTB domain-containing protein 22 n=1 Tax=Myotis daubentonii TaxID=98922 RepID=UPI002872ED02|nr:zinc finger and BTB domain-containing protein 22 [Myotis daubentonii]XP_059557986.1 zinc finger and BTB domain-containing protein 22 [Myotis daubentonii]
MEPSPLSPSGAALPVPLSLAPPPLPLPAAAVVHVSFPEVTSALLESLNQQRLQGQLCDVSIRVQGREFRAHRAVLAASSPYFHDQVLLKGMTSISLPSVMDPGAFETVLASAYTGRLSMAAADIVNFLTVGSVLQMWHIVDKCTELLREGRASATTTVTTAAASSVTAPGAGVPSGSGATVASATMGSVRSHASSRASENQSPSSSNYFSPRESTDFSSSSQEVSAASAVGSGERRGGGPVFPVPVVGSGSATSGKLLLEADELCDDGGDGRGPMVPGAALRRPTYAPPSITPQKHWIYVKRAGNCPASAPLVSQDQDLEEEEEEDLVLTCEDDEEEELGGGSGVSAGGGPEATLSISDVRTLTEPPGKGEEQVNFCESSNDFGPYEGGGPGAELDDSGRPTPSSYAPSLPSRPLLPVDVQGNQILVFPSPSSSSQAPGQPPGNQAEHGAVTLRGTSAGSLGAPGGAGGTPGGTGSGDGNKIFLCHCGKAFSHKSMRDRHVNMHLNLRPFDCPVCNKKFKMKHHLTEHMKTHTGLKPYECGVCAKKFMWRDSFMRHRGHCERRHRLGGGGGGGGGGAGPGPTGPALQPKRESPGVGAGHVDEGSGATPPLGRGVWSPPGAHKVEMGFSGGGGAH